MIVTKRAFNEALQDMADSVTAVEQELHERVDIAMSVAETAVRRAERAEVNATNLVLHPPILATMQHPENAMLRAEVDALKESIARVDRVHQMILDYLKAEIVYVPERVVTEDGHVVEFEESQQYIERKAKSRR